MNDELVRNADYRVPDAWRCLWMIMASEGHVGSGSGLRARNSRVLDIRKAIEKKKKAELMVLHVGLH